jgi:WD40 repeat protein
MITSNFLISNLKPVLASLGLATVAVLATARAGEIQTLQVESSWQPTAKSGAATGFAASPSLDKLAVVSTDGSVDILDAETHERTGGAAGVTRPPDRLLLSLAPEPLAAFSPDGKWLAVSRFDPARLIPADGGTNIVELGADISSIQFGRDGRRLLARGNKSRVAEAPDWKPVGEFRVDNARVGRPVLRPLKRHGPPNRPIVTGVTAISPDGTEVALGQNFLEVERWDVASGRLVSFASLGAGLPVTSSSRVTCLGYAPAGGRLAVVLGNRDVGVLETNGDFRMILDQRPGVATATQEEIYQAFFTPDGKELVLVAEILALGPGPFEHTNSEKTIGAEVQFWDVEARAMTRRLRASGLCYLSQAWVSSDGSRVMAVQGFYARAPNYPAERQASRLAPPRMAPAIITARIK